MALVLKDRVKESSASSGTGNITLGGAFVGYQTFNSAVASGSTVYYTIHNLAAGSDNEWEVGVGTFTAPSTLSRDTILSSSNSGSIVNFTSGPSGLEVFITQPAEEAVYINQATGKVEAFGNGTNSISFSTVVADTVTLTAGTISTNAANATDITNKQYVDGLFSTGISYHSPVLVESPTALNAVYVQPNGAGNGVGATLTNNGSNVALVIDGVSVSNTARVLVYTQANAAHNGIYTVTNPGAPDSPGPGAKWELTRATDADTYGLADPNKLGQGDAVFVQSGDTGAGETYICNTPGTITFGTTNITFSQISSAQIYSAGTGLSLNNTTFSIANTAVTAAQYGNDGNVAQITVNAQGQITNAANVAINASSITTGTLPNAQTTAASANGANTIVLRDSTGSFAANTITATTSNATTFNGTTGSFTNVSGNGSALTAINASNISSGTIANARTTASDSNSASTIVARDANGSFGANIITATFSGNAAGLSAINASNISSGTIANARTTATSSNGANAIVLRDLSGNFEANTVNAVSLIGNASQVTAINASNISSGTIANARTSASSSNGASTIVLRGASGEFAAGAITGSSFSGNGSSITDINASAITTGTIANARTTASSANGASTIVARDSGGNFSANTITATTFSGAHSGNGASLTDINASNITSGTISNARTTASSANGANTIITRGASGEFSAGAITAGGVATFSGGIAPSFLINRQGGSEGGEFQMQLPASGTSLAGNVVIDVFENSLRIYENGGSTRGASLPITSQGSIASTLILTTSSTTGINASALSTGTVPTARLASGTANSTTYLRGDSTWATLSTANDGTLTMNTSGTGISGSATFTANQSGNSTFTVTSNANSANGASTIVARDASGSFAANIITHGAGSNTAPSITTAGDTNTGVYFPAADTMAFTRGGSELVRIDATGVGINGAATVGYRLDVNGATRMNAGASEYNQVVATAGSASGLQFFRSGYNSWYLGSLNNNINFAIGESLSSPSLYFASGGNVGIGNTNPNAKLDALGTVRAQPAANQDAVAIAGRAGGTSAYVATITPTTLTASRTITLPDATTTMVGTDTTQTLTNKTFTGFTETVFAVTGTTPALSPTNGTIQTWTLSGASTPTQGTWAAGASLTLQVTAGANTITWSSIPVTWVGGSAPTLATSGITIIELWKVGTTVYGALVGTAA